eukprot:1833125-Rhodomonas_salina.4
MGVHSKFLAGYLKLKLASKESAFFWYLLGNDAFGLVQSTASTRVGSCVPSRFPRVSSTNS